MVNSIMDVDSNLEPCLLVKGAKRRVNKTKQIFYSLVAIAVLILGVTACAPLRQYRTAYDLCVSETATPSPSCETHALQQLPGKDGSSYLLGFVEFDDQGQLWDRQQMWTVINALEDETYSKDLLIVVFVHGWKHSAEPGDGNIETFRKVLAKLSATEAQLSRETGAPARQVVGIYLGWRGGSVTVPVIDNLTFWDRKNTAGKVGHGGVTEVLNRLELIKRDKGNILPGNNTRLVVVGHSFGGAVVNSAVAQILESGFVHTIGPTGTQGDVAGFGDLVVMINPAFEALLFAPLSDMSTERGYYSESQLPAVAVLTSKADYATRYAFPAGRWFSTFFERTRDLKRRNAATRQEEIVDEGRANITGVGHFDPYCTHWLYPSDTRTREQAMELLAADDSQSVLQAGASWVKDEPSSKIPFDGLVLERIPTSAGRNPYLVIHVDGHLIRSHNDIDDPRIINFIKNLILLSSQSTEQKEQVHQLAGPPPSP